ncbi:MAG: gluconolactonase, partial [Verrucomicrobiales bacterium]|nr:gluconolactonase [Verrucomicrobiales bacterium]
MPHFISIHFIIAAILLAATTDVTHGEEALWKADPFTAEKSFTAGIEGPACDAAGNIYAVNFARQQTIGKFTPDGKAEVF